MQNKTSDRSYNTSIKPNRSPTAKRIISEQNKKQAETRRRIEAILDEQALDKQLNL